MAVGMDDDMSGVTGRSDGWDVPISSNGFWEKD
jgi:hypothetical protein